MVGAGVLHHKGFLDMGEICGHLEKCCLDILIEVIIVRTLVVGEGRRTLEHAGWISNCGTAEIRCRFFGKRGDPRITLTQGTIRDVIILLLGFLPSNNQYPGSIGSCNLYT